MRRKAVMGPELVYVGFEKESLHVRSYEVSLELNTGQARIEQRNTIVFGLEWQDLPITWDFI